MGKSSIGETLGIHARKDIVREIVARGKALSLKKGTYSALVLEWWAAQGYPAVTPADQAMQDLKALKAAEGKAPKKAGNY